MENLLKSSVVSWNKVKLFLKNIFSHIENEMWKVPLKGVWKSMTKILKTEQDSTFPFHVTLENARENFFFTKKRTCLGYKSKYIR